MSTVVEVTINTKDIVNNLSSSEQIQFIIDLDSYIRDYEAALRVFEYFAKEVSDHEAWQRAKDIIQKVKERK